MKYGVVGTADTKKTINQEGEEKSEGVMSEAETHSLKGIAWDLFLGR